MEMVGEEIDIYVSPKSPRPFFPSLPFSLSLEGVLKLSPLSLGEGSGVRATLLAATRTLVF
jgi:hypothetical protein